jgi:hypothetical protein
MNKLIQGDSLEVLKTLESNSVDSLITDPPAGISFMNKTWDSDKGGPDVWVTWMKDIMRECLRVLKPGAHALVWAIPRTSHRTATALEEAGFEIRDVVTHLFGSGFPKSHNIGKKIKEFDGWGTALKPASEHWILARKPLSEKTVASNVLKHGTGGINIDASRIGFSGPNDMDPRTGKGIMFKGNSNAFKGFSEDIKTQAVFGGSTQGRFPANLVLSHNSDCVEVGQKKVKAITGGKNGGKLGVSVYGKFKNETLGANAGGLGDADGTETVAAWECTEGCAVAELDRQSGVLKSGGKQNASYSNENDGIFTPGGNQVSGFYGSSGGASRFFYCAKASKSERGEGNTHPTVKALKLMSYLIKLITPPNGIVLDPFMGSGSTGVSAKNEGFRFIGIEKEPEYIAIANRRLGI